MFRKPKILLILPLSLELIIQPSKSQGFEFKWLDQKEVYCELLVNEEIIKHVFKLSKEFARYQQEPFCLGSSHHKWLWFYEKFIPINLRTACKIALRNNSLLMDDYGKTVMEAYVSEQLKIKENEFTSIEHMNIIILTWNAAGNSPKGNLSEWFLCKSRQFENIKESPDVIVIGIQEMCELTKLLGDLSREKEWADFLTLQAYAAFQQNFVVVAQSSLVGLMILILAKPEIANNIREIAGSQVKLGLKGTAGNKGAISFRFEILETSFCVINTHLTPHKHNFKLRNENMITISRGLIFSLPNTSYSIFEHDMIF